MRFRNFILTLLALYAVWVSGVLILALYVNVRAKQQGMAVEQKHTEAFASRSAESERQYREFLESQKPSTKPAEDAAAPDHPPAEIQEAVLPK